MASFLPASRRMSAHRARVACFIPQRSVRNRSVIMMRESPIHRSPIVAAERSFVRARQSIGATRPRAIRQLDGTISITFLRTDESRHKNPPNPTVVGRGGGSHDWASCSGCDTDVGDACDHRLSREMQFTAQPRPENAVHLGECFWPMRFIRAR